MEMSKRQRRDSIGKISSDPEPLDGVEYGENFSDDKYEYRNVYVKKSDWNTVVQAVRPKRVKLLSEEQWRNMGIEMSHGWRNYGLGDWSDPVILFRREKGYQQIYGNQPHPSPHRAPNITPRLTEPRATQAVKNDDKTLEAILGEEYREDHLNYMIEIETSYMPQADLVHSPDLLQPIEFDGKMYNISRSRRLSVDYIYSFVYAKKYNRDVFFLAVNIFDRYCSTQINMSKEEFRAAVMMSILIATRLDGSDSDGLKFYADLADLDISSARQLQMKMLRALDYRLNPPLASTFIRDIIRVHYAGDIPLGIVTFYIAATAMCHEISLIIKPSELACAATRLAAELMSKKAISTPFYTPENIDEIILALRSILRMVPSIGEKMFKTYSLSSYLRASLYVEQELRKDLSNINQENDALSMFMSRFHIHLP